VINDRVAVGYGKGHFPGGRDLSKWIFRRIWTPPRSQGLLDGSWLIVVDRIKCCIPPLFLFLVVGT
jgi:hypothetical protein